MSCNEDLVFGYGIDGILNELYAKMPDAFQDDLVAMIAALIEIDEHFKLRQEGDYVLMTPGMAAWLTAYVEIVEPELSKAIASEDEAAIVQLSTQQPFEVRVASPEGDQFTAQYPESIRGKTVLMRVMTEREAQELSFLYTVRADGTFIYRPGFETQLAGNTQPKSVSDL